MRPRKTNRRPPSTKGQFLSLEKPGRSPLLAWIRDHRDYQGDDCLIWPFGCNQDGYGIFGLKRKVLYVHRFMCEHRNGPPPTPAHHAAHSCGRGTDACANPRHVSWKTNSQNQLDRREHGTSKNGKRWKLTPEQVAEIRAQQGVEAIASLSRRFGITGATVRQIHSRRIWRTGQYEAAGFTSETGRAANERKRAIRSTNGEPK